MFIKAFGQAGSDEITIAPQPYPGWTLLVPGATHFYENRIASGLIFSGIELGGLTLGILYNNNLKSDRTPYYNYPLLLGMQAYNIDKCDWLGRRLEIIKYQRPDFNYDPVEFNELLKAPFQPRNVFTPVTGGFILAACIELIIAGKDAGKGIADVEQMYFVNHYIDRDPALAVFGAVSLGAGYGAGVAEEYYFRNGLMPVWDYRFGQKKGLIYSSLFFGSMHFSNILFYEKPDYKALLLQVAEATAAGFLLGRDVQKRGYNIGPAVAAHTWYDFILMMGSFLFDPENNFLGVNIKFRL